VMFPNFLCRHPRSFELVLCVVENIFRFVIGFFEKISNGKLKKIWRKKNSKNLLVRNILQHDSFVRKHEIGAHAAGVFFFFGREGLPHRNAPSFGRVKTERFGVVVDASRRFHSSSFAAFDSDEGFPSLVRFPLLLLLAPRKPLVSPSFDREKPFLSIFSRGMARSFDFSCRPYLSVGPSPSRGARCRSRGRSEPRRPRSCSPGTCP